MLVKHDSIGALVGALVGDRLIVGDWLIVGAAVGAVLGLRLGAVVGEADRTR